MKGKQEKKILRVLIAVPVYQNCECDTFKSIYELTLPDNVETELMFFTGYTVTQARNKAAQESLNNGFDYTLFVDGDIVLPQNLLVNLLSIDSDIATGWYVKKIPNIDDNVTELYTMTFDGVTMENVFESKVPENALLPISACGFGCTLVKNDVFTQVYDGLFFEYIERKDKSITSEDIYFCNKVRHKIPDAKLIVDTSLRCLHIGKVMF